MPPPASTDLRARIPVLHAHGFSISFLCNTLGVKPSFVYKILRLYRIHGVPFDPNGKQLGRPRILTGPQLRAFQDLQKRHPMAHQDELQRMFFCHHGVYISLPTISRTLRRLRITRKKAVARASERNSLLQAVYRNRIGELVPDPWMLIFLDESSKDERTIVRRYGYGPEGKRLYQDAPFVRGKRYSVLPAITLDGIITRTVVEGSITAPIFIDFLRNYVVCPECCLISIACS
jgi:transposase